MNTPTLDDFIAGISRPLFTYRMARGRTFEVSGVTAAGDAQIRAAYTRLERSAARIEETVLHWVWDRTSFQTPEEAVGWLREVVRTRAKSPGLAASADRAEPGALYRLVERSVRLDGPISPEEWETQLRLSSACRVLSKAGMLW